MGSARQSGPGSPLHSPSHTSYVSLGKSLNPVGVSVLINDLENRQYLLHRRGLNGCSTHNTMPGTW